MSETTKTRMGNQACDVLDRPKQGLNNAVLRINMSSFTLHSRGLNLEQLYAILGCRVTHWLLVLSLSKVFL